MNSEPDASPQRSFPSLFSELPVGRIKLKNRVIIPAHTMLLGERDGTIGDRYRGYLVERAAGGAAVVGIESSPVAADSWSFPQQIHLWDRACLASLARSARDVNSHGAQLSMMLWHGGRNVPHVTGNAPISASAIPSLQSGDTPRALGAAEIPAIVEAYALAAQICLDAGIAMLEVQTASDYLLGTFLSSRLNRRNDRYGGSPENRVRLVLEILAAIRRRIGDSVALGIRTSVAHSLPLDPQGYGIDESLALVQLIAGSGLIDYVSLMTGSNGAMHHTIPPMGSKRERLTDASMRLKSALSIPVFVAGRIKTPEEAERIIASGAADAVGMARALIADAHWPRKAQAGSVATIRPCISCNQGCLAFASRLMPAGCIVNPTAGHEFELNEFAEPRRRANTRRRVAVVGGGPAGLEAARTLAEQGFSVQLYEREPELGGAFRMAAQAPHRDEMLPMLRWWELELRRLGVQISLSTPVKSAAAVDAELVVWATGASPGWTMLWKNRPQLVDGLPGAARRAHGRDVLARRAHVQGRILVIDEEGSWPAVSLVEALLAQPNVAEVLVLTSTLTLGGTDLFLTAEAVNVQMRLRDRRVAVKPGTFVARVDGAYVDTLDGERLGPFDDIVLSMGAVSRPVPHGAIAIGDCVAPRSIWAATQEGARVHTRLQEKLREQAQ